MKKQKKQKSIALIKKANNLIEARYKFDIWEMRFFLSLLSDIDHDDSDLRVYRIWFKDVVKTFGLKTKHSYDLLREGVKGMMSRSMYVNVEDENGFIREHRYNIVSYANTLVHAPDKMDKSSQEYVDVKIAPEAKPLLLQLQKSFTYYDLSNITQLGVYAIRVYELLKQYENIGQRTLKIEDIKKMFEITNEYPRFSNFYQKVIKPAVKEINQYTDLYVSEPEKIKEGRSVEALLFRVQRKANTLIKRTNEGQSKTLFNDAQHTIVETTEVAEINEEQSEKDKLYLKFEEIVVKNFGVTPSVFMQFLNHYNAQQIEQAIRIVHRAKANGQIKTSVSGFFVQALKGGYTDIKEEQAKKKLSETQKQQQQAEIAQRKAERDLERSRLINDKIRKLVSENPNLTMQAIEKMNTQTAYQTMISMKEKYLGRTLELEDFRQDEFLREAVKMSIIELKKEQFDDIFKDFS